MNFEVSYFTRTFFILLIVLCGSQVVLATDFETRCSAPGVIKCVGFDQQQDIDGDWGDNHGSMSRETGSPAIDTNVTASGQGSLKFTSRGDSGSMGGDYFTNFSDDLSVVFGENSQFYVQFRQRFSDTFLNTQFSPDSWWKQLIVGTGDKPNCETVGSSPSACSTSCTDLEVVLTSPFYQGFPVLYRTCDGSTHLSKAEGLDEPFGEYDFKLQNARPAPYCLYSQSSSSYFPPGGNCFGYFPNEWMTFQLMIETGPRVNDEFVNSKVKLWVAREGEPSEIVIDFDSVYLGAGSAAKDQKFGKVFLLPYITSKAANGHPTAHTWYDELIISTNKIEDPDGEPVTRPNAPTNLREGQ